MYNICVNIPSCTSCIKRYLGGASKIQAVQALFFAVASHGAFLNWE